MVSVAIAMTALVLITACGSGASHDVSSVAAGGFGTLPSNGTPTNGGTVYMAETPGQGPDYIYPITPASAENLATENSLQNLLYMPLWWYVNGDNTGIDYRDSLAGAPVFSNDNKTITITLNPGWKWSDGTPVTSTDIAFFIDTLRAAVNISPANYGNLTPGLFPDFIDSVQTPNARTIRLTLNKTYNQNFVFLDQLDLIVPLPAHAWSRTSINGPIINFRDPANAKAIYKFLAAQSTHLSTYGSNPLWKVVDGPFQLTSFDPSTDGLTMKANTNYTGPVKPHISTLVQVAFTSPEAEFNQLLAGTLTAGPLDASYIPQIATLKSKGYTVWGYPASYMSFMPYNFKDTTGDFDSIIKQLYIRQALAHLNDEHGIIQSRGVFNGAAGPDYGAVPPIPQNAFAPPVALSNPYPFSVAEASSLLSARGWKVVPGGTTTCAKPGTASGQCGAGIPAGTALAWNLVYGSSPTYIGQEAEVLASNAKKIGITIALVAKTPNYINSNLSDVSNPSNANSWAMLFTGGFTVGIYPTTNSMFNTTGGLNAGGYSAPTADADISNSVRSLSNTAVQTELSYLTRAQPVLFEPNPDVIWAFKNSLGGPAFSFESVSQYQPNPAYWYLKSSK
jgi:peptide/nickel transport system substrate-binding protein